jgi:hypothetical protein
VRINPDQFSEALDIVKRSKGMIEGSDAQKVFKAVGIRSWPMEEMPISSGREYGLESRGGVHRGETLNTAQSHLHGPTVREYMKNPPEENPHAPGEPYLPEVYQTTRGSKWIDEGHHRIVASRLRGDYGTEVYEGYIK